MMAERYRITENRRSFDELDEQRSLQRISAYSHLESSRRCAIEQYDPMAENFPAGEGVGAAAADSLNLSLVRCTPFGCGKRGTKTELALSGFHQKILDAPPENFPLTAPPFLWPSRSFRAQLNTSGDPKVSSDVRISSPYINLRKEVETPHREKSIDSSRGKSSRCRGGIFLGFNSCCKNNAISGNFKLRSRAKLHETKTPPTSNGSWEQERAWNVIASVDNQMINKKIVLKRSLRGAVLHDSKFVDAIRDAKFAEAIPDAKFAKTTPPVVLASDGSHTHESDQDMSVPAVSFPSPIHDPCNSCNFRLSTSSADASPDVDAFAWDKEHLSFTSEDSTLSFLELLKLGRSEGMPRPDEISTRESGVAVSNRNQTPATPAIAASAVSGMQIPSSKGMGLNTLAEQDAQGGVELPSINGVSNKYDDDPLDDSYLSFQRKLRKSVAMIVISDNPYHDFKQSMLEMIIENKLSKSIELENLLEYYLSLNTPCFHDVIVEVFTDIWLQLLHTNS